MHACMHGTKNTIHACILANTLTYRDEIKLWNNRSYCITHMYVCTYYVCMYVRTNRDDIQLWNNHSYCITHMYACIMYAFMYVHVGMTYSCEIIAGGIERCSWKCLCVCAYACVIVCVCVCNRFWRACVCVCTCIHVYINVCICVYTCMSVCMYTYIHIYLYISECRCTHACMPLVYSYTHTHSLYVCVCNVCVFVSTYRTLKERSPSPPRWSSWQMCPESCARPEIYLSAKNKQTWCDLGLKHSCNGEVLHTRAISHMRCACDAVPYDLDRGVRMQKQRSLAHSRWRVGNRNTHDRSTNFLPSPFEPAWGCGWGLQLFACRQGAAWSRWCTTGARSSGTPVGCNAMQCAVRYACVWKGPTSMWACVF